MNKPQRPLHGLRIAGAALLALLGVLLQSAVLYFLWNWLTPKLFGWPMISPWEALGLFTLSKILFGRIMFRFPPMLEKSVMRLRLDKKLSNMNDIEREQFRAELAERIKHLSKGL